MNRRRTTQRVTFDVEFISPEYSKFYHQLRDELRKLDDRWRGVISIGPIGMQEVDDE